MREPGFRLGNIYEMSFKAAITSHKACKIDPFAFLDKEHEVFLKVQLLKWKRKVFITL